MSFAGQWISNYAGSNSGTIVVDIEYLGDRYHGVACVWDNQPDVPSTLVRFIIDSKAPLQTLQNIKTVPIVAGKVLTQEELHGWAQRAGFVFPNFTEITLNLQPPQLAICWKTSIGTHGATTAILSPACGGLPSVLQPIPKIRTWEAFKRYVSGLTPNQYVFRGQERAEWRIRTTFHRSNRCILEKFLTDDVKALNRVFSGLSSHKYNISDPNEYGAFLSLAQHHGYPTPLLDWTWSPYVAAFFAYRNLRNNRTSKRSDKVRILKFPAKHWNLKMRHFDGLFPYPQHVSLLEPLAIGNARAIPQQAIAMITNLDDIETYLSQWDERLEINVLEAIDLPAASRTEVMRDLALMGITAASLFPGLDGACEALREQNFGGRI